MNRKRSAHTTNAHKLKLLARIPSDEFIPWRVRLLTIPSSARLARTSLPVPVRRLMQAAQGSGGLPLTPGAQASKCPEARQDVLRSAHVPPVSWSQRCEHGIARKENWGGGNAPPQRAAFDYSLRVEHAAAPLWVQVVGGRPSIPSSQHPAPTHVEHSTNHPYPGWPGCPH